MQDAGRSKTRRSVGGRRDWMLPLSAHIGGITPSLPKSTAPLCKEPSD
jgi:hypothetical protein